MKSDTRPDAGASGTGAIERYLGLRDFEERHHDLFFGRDAEKAELLRVVRRSALTVLFGVSGLGKTSLLQAGLFPALRGLDMVPVAIRLEHRTDAPELAAQVLARTRSALQDARVEAAPARPGETLWEYFHRVPFWNARNRLVTPLLVIDQFEEIFTQERDQRRVERFAEQLGDLVGNRIPDAVRRRAESGDALPRFVEAPAPATVVLSLREDFLPALEDLRREIPAIAENRYRLLPMSGDAALECVVGPGRDVVTDEVAHRIVRFVAAAGTRPEDSGTATEPDRDATTLAHLHVEPALLSLVCAELDDRRRERGLQAITPDLVAGASEQILSDFYARSVADVPRAMRVLVEERLIDRAGFRSSEPLENVLGEPGVTPESVENLINRRVLRQEDRFGTRHVELIHDRLTVVVREARDRRRAQETRQRRRRQIAAAAAAGVLVLGIGLAVARRERVAKLAYVANLAAENARFQRQLEDVTAFMDKGREGERQTADGRLDLALQAYRERLEIAQRLVAMNASNSTWQRNVALAHQEIGDVLEARNEPSGAREEYRAAVRAGGLEKRELEKRIDLISFDADWFDAAVKAAAPVEPLAVPAGEFFMGCNQDQDKQCDADEMKITEGSSWNPNARVGEFSIDRTEVTVAAYAACVAAGGCNADGVKDWNLKYCNWGEPEHEQHPMNCVNWEQARAYCAWAGKRLPTEAEWEKAARGADGRKFPWGSESYTRRGPPLANLAGAPRQDDRDSGTAPVGSFPAGASPYGALDMAGNVWEWVADEFGNYSDRRRGVRGGSWLVGSTFARTSNRDGFDARDRYAGVGFRCAQ